MMKLISVGAIIGGLILIFLLAPTFMHCSATGGVRFCDETPGSLATMALGGALLLAGSGGLAAVTNREYQQAFKDLAERDQEATKTSPAPPPK